MRQSLAEQSRAEQSRAEQSRAEQSRAEQSRLTSASFGVCESGWEWENSSWVKKLNKKFRQTISFGTIKMLWRAESMRLAS